MTFITSPYVIQDLPFGEKTLKLSSNTEIKVPNVVKILIPEKIVQQYLCYCDETGFAPMSRSKVQNSKKFASRLYASPCKDLAILSRGRKSFRRISGYHRQGRRQLWKRALLGKRANWQIKTGKTLSQM